MNTFHGQRRQWAIVAFAVSLAYLLALEKLMQPYAIGGVYFQQWTSEDMMQALPIADLREQPLASLYYLHIQPPAVDVLRLMLAQLWPQIEERSLLVHVDQGLYVVWALFGAGTVALICYWLMQVTSHRYAVIAALVFLLHPALILYATLLDNTILSVFLTTWSSYELWRLSRTQNSVWRLALAVVALFFTRSTFQWPVLILYAVSLWLLRLPARKVILFLGLAGAVIGAYTLKQYIVFGIPYTSSFAGLNCYHALAYIDSYADAGVTAVDIPYIAPASALHRETKLTGVPNFNQVWYLAHNTALMPKCIERILTQPASDTALAYFSNWLIYVLPSAQYTTPSVIADRLPWRAAYNTMFSGMGWAALLFAAALWWWLNQRRRWWTAMGLALPVLFVVAASVMLERGENMRYKFFIEPVLFVFIASQLPSIWHAIRWQGMAAGPGPEGRGPGPDRPADAAEDH